MSALQTKTIPLEIPEIFVPVLTSTARFIVLIGGRDSAKSSTVGRILVQRAHTERADILCGREYQNSIDDSVHKLLKSLIEDLGVPGADPTEKKIDFAEGGGFRYKGFARNPSGVRSAQNFKYSWVEEAQDLSQDSIDVLLPTIRASGSQLFFSANPQASNDPFSQTFIVPFLTAIESKGYYQDTDHLIIMANYYDNPFHGPEMETQRKRDKARMSRAKYDHIWHGAFNDEVEDSIIMAEWFDAAVDAHKKLGFKPRGARVVAHDPSDTGPDPKSLCLSHGSVILDVRERDDLDVNDGCDWATDYAIENDADLFVWDGDGMGVSLRRQVSRAFDGKKIEFRMYRGSEKPDYPKREYEPVEGEDKGKRRTNEDTFFNKRAQFSWTLRDKFYRTYLAVEKGEYSDPNELISISSGVQNLKKLRSETCRIPRKYNGRGLIQIMPKIEMKTKLKIASPNEFDAMVMSQERPAPRKAERKPITVPNLQSTWARANA